MKLKTEPVSSKGKKMNAFYEDGCLVITQKKGAGRWAWRVEDLTGPCVALDFGQGWYVDIKTALEEIKAL